MCSRILAFVRLGRPRFLMGGFVLYAGGALLARDRVRDLDLGAYAFGQCAITATQLMTHYANDYFDLEADRQNRAATRWSGGSRVLVEEGLAPRVARDAAIVLAALALAIDVAIAVVYGSLRVPAVTMLLGALVLSWGYSGPPLRLHQRGLGPLTAGIVVGALTPLTGWAMQGGSASRDLVMAVSSLAIAQLTLILVLDLPDAEGDAAADKRTLAVRFGTVAVSRVAIVLVGLAYAPIVVALVGAASHVGWTMLATAPIGLTLVHALVKARWHAGEASALTWRAVVWFAALSGAVLAGALFRQQAR
jgi:1,4-dihydroxy-2-naphthoate polyprenyltransferase